MSNCVEYAINQVTNADIDDYILKLAFEQPNGNFAGNWFNIVNNTTVEQGIREKVIHRTVLPACNANGGKTEMIDLSGSEIRDLGNGCIEVNVPDIVTGGRKIISVTEIYLGSMTSSTGMLGMSTNTTDLCGQGSITDMTEGLIDSMSSNRSMPVTYNNIHMTGNNCFVIFGLNSGTYSMSGKMILEYDQGLSSISTRQWEHFAKLVLLATKAYIYRTCRRPAQEAVMRAGIPLSEIKDDIMEYRDAWTQYQEFLTGEWTKRMAYSDRQRVTDSIRRAVPRRM